MMGSPILTGAAQRPLRLLLMGSLLIAAAACSSGGGGANGSSATSDGAEVASDEAASGGGAAAGDSLELPPNLTIALPGDGKLTASITDTGFAYVTAEFGSDRFDEIVSFYDDWSQTDPRTWSGGDSSFESGGTAYRAWLWNSAASRISVVECTSSAGSDAVCVEISEYEE
jgi:hypothetical protein